jgi:hypothetical protein
VPNVVNNKVLPPKKKDSSYTNAENGNGRKIQWKFTAGDSYTDATVPNVVNNKVLPPKENHDSHTNVKDKDEGVTKWGFSDAYSSSTQPLHTAGKPLMKHTTQTQLILHQNSRMMFRTLQDSKKLLAGFLTTV